VCAKLDWLLFIVTFIVYRLLITCYLC